MRCVRWHRTSRVSWFSKSGLGAWNISRQLGSRITATIIFDAPVTRHDLPPWETADFYANNLEWQQDLPASHLVSSQTPVRDGHQLILVLGENFFTRWIN